LDQKDTAAELAKLSTDPRAGTYFQVLVHVGGYIHAMSSLLEASIEDQPFSYEQAFYTEALYRMLADWLTVPDGAQRVPLADALSVVGLEGLAEPLVAVMDTSLNGATFGAFVREFRAAQMSVEAFAGNLPEQIARALAVPQQDMADRVSAALDSMFEEMLDLQGALERYFEEEYRALYTLIRDSDFFFSVLHHPWQPQASEG
jgi:hypothetical protein